MLTGNLNLTRYRNGIATPFIWEVKEKNLKFLREMIGLFDSSAGRKRYEIEEDIKSFYVEKVNPKIVQGIAKILFKRCEFIDFNEEDPVENRNRVFTASAEYWRQAESETSGVETHKRKILNNLDLAKKEILGNTDSWLFGDILSNQKLDQFDPPDPEALIHRYNIEQVQGLLLYARSLDLTVDLKKDHTFRQMIQMLKFYQLMFEVVDSDESKIAFRVDGPGSILENSRSYGVEFANFFPAIPLLKTGWTLKCQLKVPGRRRIFQLELTQKAGYHSFYSEKGVWKQKKITDLINRFNEKYAESHLAKSENQMIPLRDNQFLVPDLIITDKEKQSSQLMVEWVYYRSESSMKRLGKLAKELPENYVFALRGKKSQMGPLIKKLGKKLILFAKEPTAPGLRKKFDEFY